VVLNFISSSLFFNIVKKLQMVILKFFQTVSSEYSYCTGPSGRGTATLISSVIQGTDKTWILDSPVKIPYESLWSDVSREEDGPTRGKYQEAAHLSIAVFL
jgi:hypothetical protein